MAFPIKINTYILTTYLFCFVPTNFSADIYTLIFLISTKYNPSYGAQDNYTKQSLNNEHLLIEEPKLLKPHNFSNHFYTDLLNSPHKSRLLLVTGFLRFRYHNKVPRILPKSLKDGGGRRCEKLPQSFKRSWQEVP